MTVIMLGHKGVPSRSGGIERHVEELSTSLAGLGVRIISYDRPWYVGDLPSPAGVERRFSHGLHTKHLDAITHTLNALWQSRREQPDVIHIHGVGPSLMLPLARLFHPRARLVVTFHCVDRKHAKWGMFAQTMLHIGEWFACRFADRTIVVSDALASYCLNEYECQPSVIPNGVRMPSAKPISLIERLSLSPKRYFFMATRLVAHKNVHVAIEAHRLLAERRPDLAREYPLIIAGASSWTDTYARSLYTQATGLPFVRLIGERHDDELAALQMHAACHLSVSSSEGMSIALLEAGALARPVIVSDIPENTEVTGTLMPSVPAGDVQVLSDAMECAALMSDAERDNAGARFHARVTEHHDWERIAEMTKDVYDELLVTERVLIQSHAM